MKQATWGLVLAIVTIISCAAGILSSAPPDVVPAGAAAEEFSAERALAHLRMIASDPHPMGSAEHDRVRQYLSAELDRLGIDNHVQTAQVIRQFWRNWTTASRVRNILARIPGSQPGSAILLAAHYDTVPNSTGAGDDGSAVVALLETLRALAAGPQLRNDVIVLITDGEEAGLLGARAFVDEHEWAAEVDLILNFEARGTEGPVLMFETQGGTAALIAGLDRAASPAFATSLSGEIYRRMPNDTDFSILRQTGAPGMNFAFIGGESTYHTAQDNLDRLDLRSVQHHGEYALSLARHFGNLDLEASLASPRQAVYFNLLSSLVSYPQAWVIPLALICGALLAFLLFRGFRQGRLSAGGLALATVYNLLGATLLAAAMYFVAQWAIGYGYVFSVLGGLNSQNLMLLGLCCVAVAITLGSYHWRAARQLPGNLIGGGLVVWWVLVMITAWVVPGASYLFTVPMLISLGVAWAWLASNPPAERDGAAPVSWLHALATLVAGIVTALLWAPLIHSLGTALGFVAVPAASLVIFLLLHGVLAPQQELLGLGRGRWWIPALALVAGLAVAFTTQGARQHDPANRAYDSLLFYVDTETGESSWVSYDYQLGPWVEKFFPDRAERQQVPAWLDALGPSEAYLSNAPTPPYPAAEVELLAAESVAEGRRLTLRVHWSEQVGVGNVLLSSPGSLAWVEVGGSAIEPSQSAETDDSRPGLNLRYLAPPREGFEFTVVVGEEAELQVETVAQIFSLPALAATHGPRPADLMPRRSWTSDSTLVRHSLTLPPGAEPAPAIEQPADDGTNDTLSPSLG